MTLEAFQSWVLQTGLVVSLLIVIILIIRRPFARLFGANAAYALWCLPLIRLVMPGLSIPQSWLPKPLQPISEPRPNLEVMPDIGAAPINFPAIVVESSETAVEHTLPWESIAISIWLGVAVLWLAVQLYQQYRFKAKLRSESTVLGDALKLEMVQAAQRVGLRKTPLVRVSEENTGPFVTGVFRPLIILPRNFEQTFDLQQRHFALVHEFAHIKRCDLWVALVTLIFRAINWPNPLVHYAAHKLRSDQEAACDAFVVKVTGGDSTHSYAETLVKAVRQEMKKLLNFGVADPLTLGMGHPVAERLETLGRARPTTWRSRSLALSAMSVIAIASAPLGIAADATNPEVKTQTEERFAFGSKLDGTSGQSYEIVTEDGVKKAYRILDGGDRKEVDLVQKDDGTYRLTYEDGKTVDLPNIDLEKLDSLKDLSELKNLERFNGLTALQSLEGLDALKDIDISGGKIQIVKTEGNAPIRFNASELSDDIQNRVVHFFENNDLSSEQLDDTVVTARFDFFESSDPLANARRQLERTKKQLESLSSNENLSFDLKNALRDIESAQKSLEEAESRLLSEEK